MPADRQVPLEAAAELLLGLLRRTHLSTAADVAGVVADQALTIGATDTTMYLVDPEQSTLMPLSSVCRALPIRASRPRARSCVTISSPTAFQPPSAARENCWPFRVTRP